MRFARTFLNAVRGGRSLGTMPLAVYSPKVLAVFHGLVRWSVDGDASQALKTIAEFLDINTMASK
jgi:hypothetical protein